MLSQLCQIFPLCPPPPTPSPPPQAIPTPVVCVPRSHTCVPATLCPVLHLHPSGYCVTANSYFLIPSPFTHLLDPLTSVNHQNVLWIYGCVSLLLVFHLNCLGTAPLML